MLIALELPPPAMMLHRSASAVTTTSARDATNQFAEIFILFMELNKQLCS